MVLYKKMFCETSDLQCTHVFGCSGVYSFNTARQHVSIVDTKEFGEALFIDGEIQSTLKDEYIYHNTICKEIMSKLTKPNNNILIIGGAEGCLLRDFCKYDIVSSVTQVDWDEELVNYFKQKTNWNHGAYYDSRVKLVFEDAFTWIENALTKEEKYDAIVVDLVDPDESYLSKFLIFLEKCKHLLDSKGMLIANGGTCNPWNNVWKVCVDSLEKNEDAYITNIIPINVPSYHSPWILLYYGPIHIPFKTHEYFFEPWNIDSIKNYYACQTKKIQTYKKEIEDKHRVIDISQTYGC